MVTIRMEVRSNRIPEIVAQARPRALEAVNAALFAVEGHAKSIVPVDTGALKNSIHVTPADAGTLSGECSASMDYAVYVEYGTYRSPAQPYMTPAAEAAAPGFQAAMADIFR